MIQINTGADNMKIQKAAWFTPIGRGSDGKEWGRWGLIINWIGDVGTGKTSKMTKAAKECGLDCTVVALGLREPGDILGLPIPCSATKSTEYYPPKWASDTVKNPDRPVVIYFDEMNHGTPSVQGAVQRVLNERFAGDYQLPDHVLFAISINPVDQAQSSGGGDIAVAVANRICHLPWQNGSVEEWCEWLTAGGMNQEIVEERTANSIKEEVLKKWPEAYAMASSKVRAYMRANSSELHKLPDLNSPQSSAAFGTARSWYNATLALASSYVHDLSPTEREMFVGGFVGSSAARSFFNWMEQLDLPDVPKLLEGQEKFEHDIARFDRTFATTAACLSMIFSEPAGRRRDVWVFNFMLLLASLASSAKDVSLSCTKELMRCGKSGIIPGAAWAHPEISEKILKGSHELLSFADSLRSK